MSDRRQRLENLKEILESAPEPVSGVSLAERLDVSRQAIVQDVATLREQGLPVVATSRGYHLERAPSAFRRIVAVRHQPDRIFEELSLIVSLGGKVLDVLVDHPVYGELRGNINVGTADEVTRFVTLMETTGRHPLLTLSDGFHLHNVEAPDEETLLIIQSKLKEAGLLVLF